MPTSAEISKMRTAALLYAKDGFPVFPLHSPTEGGCSCGKRDCDHPGKHPRTPHGFKDATTDPIRIADWWQKWPDANIGMPTGSASRLIAVDIDPRNGGDDSFAELRLQFGEFPRTAEQMTGGGGRHLFFRNPGGKIPRELAPGIDLKGEGGYVVMAPSFHSSGKPYQWDCHEGSKALLHPAVAPKWLLDRISTPRNGTSEGEKWPRGTRNDQLTSVAGTMRRRGLSREAIEAALLEENRRRCDPPLPDGEVRRIAGSVASYEPADDAPPHTEADDCSGPHISQQNWPDELSQEAYHGVSGQLVATMEPHSEADPAAILIQFLVAFGNLIGRSAYFEAEADRHFTNLFTVLVGQTAKGRKGTSLGQVQRVLRELDPAWAATRNMSGLASGEGLIWAVRDEVRERTPIRERGRVIEYEEVVSDHGERDKRLMVVEPEFARVLQVAERESNTLSAIIRQAWDTGNLRILTKKQSTCSTDAHISIIGHITRDELKKLLTDTAVGNGFANRFLWVCTKRSKLLPEGGALNTVNLQPIISQVRTAAGFARSAGAMRRDTEAREVWCAVYPPLSEGKPGLLGSVTSRSEAQTMRLACLYALLDCSPMVKADHLLAALEVWRYCEESARYIFGDSLGDATADEIIRELRQRPRGLTRNDIRDHFNRNRSSAEIARALVVLQEYGLAHVKRNREDESQKRPPERWFAADGLRD